jgi:hypothetical protein
MMTRKPSTVSKRSGNARYYLDDVSVLIDDFLIAGTPMYGTSVT